MDTLYSPNIIRHIVLGDDCYEFRPLRLTGYYGSNYLLGHAYINLDTPIVDIPRSLLNYVIERGTRGRVFIAPYYVARANRNNVPSFKNAVIGGMYAMQYYNHAREVAQINVKNNGNIYLNGAHGIFDSNKTLLFEVYDRFKRDKNGKLVPIGIVAKVSDKILADQENPLYKTILKYIVQSITGTEGILYYSGSIEDHIVTRLFDASCVEKRGKTLPVSVEFYSTIPGFETTTVPSPLVTNEEICQSILSAL